MATGTSSKPSFSRGRKWSIGLNVFLTVLAVLSVLVMVNYLSGTYFRRLNLSTNAQTELSPRTLSLLSSMTNQVQITLYYDKDEPFYSDISELLRAYTVNCPNITVERVDYNREPGKAQEIKAKYKLSAKTDRNVIIFDCDGRTRVVPGSVLPEYTYEQATNQPRGNLNYKLIAFKGEMMFTAQILSVINPKPLYAGFLQGHGEHRADEDSDIGYLKFRMALAQDFVQTAPIKLLGTNTVPADCDLLVIAGPRNSIPQIELDRIEQYLNEGGRLFVLFNIASGKTGLEKLLARWGVQVGEGVVRDPDNCSTSEMEDVLISDYSRHPVVNPLLESGAQIQLIVPRPISRVDTGNEGLKAEDVAQSGPRSRLGNIGDPTQKPHPYSLIVAVEKAPVKGAAEHGPTRILVAGDSMFLNNRYIESGANRDFAGYAFHWLLDRSTLPQGIGPKPVTEHRWLVSQSRQRVLTWILLGAIPGGILLFGGLVWIRRRK